MRLYVHVVSRMADVVRSTCSVWGFTFDNAVVVPLKASCQAFRLVLGQLGWTCVAGRLWSWVLCPGSSAVCFRLCSCKTGLREVLALHHSSCPRVLDKLPRSPESGRLSPAANLHLLCNIKIFYEIDLVFWTALLWKFQTFHRHLGLQIALGASPHALPPHMVVPPSSEASWSLRNNGAFTLLCTGLCYHEFCCVCRTQPGPISGSGSGNSPCRYHYSTICWHGDFNSRTVSLALSINTKLTQSG